VHVIDRHLVHALEERHRLVDQRDPDLAALAAGVGRAVGDRLPLVR
jgi:hypothetical protein